MNPAHAFPAVRRPRWSIEQFSAFWAAPNLDAPSHLAPEVRAFWSGRDAPLVGIDAYLRPLRGLLRRVPDFRLQIAEHAENADFIFVRWVAHGTWRDAPLLFTGADRIRQREGQVIENYIFCHHPLVDEVMVELGEG